MNKFNLNDYATVKERKELFYSDNPDGRIVVKNITPPEQLLEFSLFEAYIYVTAEDQEKNLPKATGTALEMRDKEMKKSRAGNDYETVNYTSWNENCEESAVGRALDNAGYSGNLKPSREEMQKVQRAMNKNIKTVTKAQITTIKSEMKSAGIDEPTFCKVFKVSGVSELPSSKYTEAVKRLKAKAGTDD